MTSSSIVRRVKSTRGTTAVEFALVAILLLTLMLGIFEGGRVFHGWLVITNEAREAARHGAVECAGDRTQCCASTGVVSYVMDRMSGGLEQDPVVTCTTPQDPDTSDRLVRVQIDHTVEIVTPLISALWPDFTLTAVSQMRSE